MKKVVVILAMFLVAVKLFAIVELKSFKLEDVKLINNPNSHTPLTGKFTLGDSDDFKKIIFHIETNGVSFDLVYPKNKANVYPIIGLYADVKSKVTFTIHSNKGFYRYTKPLYIKTPPLPTNPINFPKIDVVIAENTKNQMQGGFTLFNPRRETKNNEFNKAFGMLTVVDKYGNVVWYHEANSRISDFDILQDGLISYMTADHRVIIIDMFGNTVKSYHTNFYKGDKTNSILVDVDTFHHDVTQLPDGNFVVLSSIEKQIPNYYTSEQDENAPRKTQNVVGDLVVVFDKNGKILWKWNAFDYLDPFRIGYESFSGYWNRRGYKNTVDWSHANFVRYDEKSDSFYVNFRYLSSIIKIDKKTKEIVWIFGEPSGYTKEEQKKLIRLDDKELYPWHQHSPKIVNENEILFFNNDNYRARPFDEPVDFDKTWSYAVKYKIDPKTLQAEELWSSKGVGERLHSVAMGDVDSLANGNVLASFGMLVKKIDNKNDVWSSSKNSKPQDKFSMLREYSNTNPPKIVWEMKLTTLNNDKNVSWSIFGGERFYFYGMENLK